MVSKASIGGARNPLLRTTFSSQFRAEGLFIKRSDLTAFPIAIKAYHQFQTASGKFRDKLKFLKSPAARAAFAIQEACEAAIIKELGGVRVKSGVGGLSPDFVMEDFGPGREVFHEGKLIKAYQKAGTIVREGSEPLGLAGGSGVTVRDSGKGVSSLISGFSEKAALNKAGLPTGKREISPDYEEVNTSKFYNALLKQQGRASAQTNAGIIAALKLNDPAAKLFKAGIVRKASNIHIPVNYGNIVKDHHIVFTWKSIVAAINSKQADFKVSKKAKTDDAVLLQFDLKPATIEKLLNSINQAMVTVLKGGIGEDIIEGIAAAYALMDAKTAATLVKELKKLKFFHALRYLAGSAIISRAVLKAKSKPRQSKKPIKPQRLISGAQITALVQKRLQKIMPQGPRRGPPLSPTIMTNRTGRFRRSVHVVPRYRENLMRYTYDPIYMSLMSTPYNPDNLLSDTIREVVISLFNRQFAILRAQ